jgi:hypothetical protein
LEIKIYFDPFLFFCEELCIALRLLQKILHASNSTTTIGFISLGFWCVKSIQLMFIQFK